MKRKDIIDALANVIDPEIGMDILTLGLIYKVEFNDENEVNIDMTLTFSGCPLADMMKNMAKNGVESIEGVKSVKINLIFEPQWNQTMISEDNYKNLLEQ